MHTLTVTEYQRIRIADAKVAGVPTISTAQADRLYRVVQSLGIRYLSGELKPYQVASLFPERYRDDSINPDDVWGEQFVVGDLLPGIYEVSFTLGKVFKQKVEVRAGELSIAAFCLDR